jgi:hypothetical protein
LRITKRFWLAGDDDYLMGATSINQKVALRANFKMYSPSEYCTHFNVWRHVIFSVHSPTSLGFVSHSNGMTSCQNSSAENVSCNVAPFFYHHSVVIQHLVSTLVICLKFVFIEMLDKLITYIVCWYNTLYQVLSVAWTNRIATRRFQK